MMLQHDSKMLWDALGCFEILQDGFGMLRDALGCSGMLEDWNQTFKQNDKIIYKEH